MLLQNCRCILIFVAVVMSSAPDTTVDSLSSSSPPPTTRTTTAVATSDRNPSFDSRNTLSRVEARDVYDDFARKGDNVGGNDAESGYGGPAVKALIDMADFDDDDSSSGPQHGVKTVFEFGTGQGKLAALVLGTASTNTQLQWRGVDQSPLMVEGFRNRCVDRFGAERCSVELLESGNPSELFDQMESESIDRFVSTYVLDLLSEDDIYNVLDLAEKVLHRQHGKLLLAGITWGYRGSLQTSVMTAAWEVLYTVWRTKVGGCRPQALQPYLKARGWTIEKTVTTLPDGYPWMASEVICARPPRSKS